MASKSSAIGRFVDEGNGMGKVILEIPFDAKDMTELVRHAPRDKKSVTLVSANVVGDLDNRGKTSPLYVDVNHQRVELQGSMSLYISLAGIGGGGSPSSTAQREMNDAERKAAIARDDEERLWVTLKADLLDARGELIREQGDRILTEVFSRYIQSGCYLDSDQLPEHQPGGAILHPPKHPTLTDAQHNAIVNEALDSAIAATEK